MRTIERSTPMSAVLAHGDAAGVVRSIAPEVLDSPMVVELADFPSAAILGLILGEDDPRIAQIMEGVADFEDLSPRPAIEPPIVPAADYESSAVPRGSARVDASTRGSREPPHGDRAARSFARQPLRGRRPVGDLPHRGKRHHGRRLLRRRRHVPGSIPPAVRRPMDLHDDLQRPLPGRHPRHDQRVGGRCPGTGSGRRGRALRVRRRHAVRAGGHNRLRLDPPG